MRATILGLACALAIAACAGDDKISRTLGGRCDVTSDCADRCLAPSNDYPEGFCSIDCLTSGECPSDAECADKEGGVCLFSCRDNPDCSFLGPTWVCREQNLRSDQNQKVMVCLGN